MHDLHEITYTAEQELMERTAKYLERTDNVYKPSKTVTFDRNGEMLLYSCNNIKNNIVYLKYPYIMYDCLIPITWYINFVNPFMWKWQVTLTMFYMAHGFAWVPHMMYLKALDKRIHQVHLLRGGKYLKMTAQTAIGDRYVSWASIAEMHLLTEDYMEYADPDEADFLTKEGQLKYEVQVEFEYYMDQCVNVNDEIIYFMKEGTVHQPEVFEQVIKGNHIDTTDFEINTAHNNRYLEPNHNPFS